MTWNCVYVLLLLVLSDGHLIEASPASIPNATNISENFQNQTGKNTLSVISAMENGNSSKVTSEDATFSSNRKIKFNFDGISSPETEEKIFNAHNKGKSGIIKHLNAPSSANKKITEKKTHINEEYTSSTSNHTSVDRKPKLHRLIPPKTKDSKMSTFRKHVHSVSDSVAVGSAPIPTFIKPKIVTRYFSLTESNGNDGKSSVTSDLTASGTVPLGMKTKQLLASPSSYYYRPIYDHDNYDPLHKSHPDDHDGIDKHGHGHDRPPFTNGHRSHNGYESKHNNGHVSEHGHDGRETYDGTAGFVDDQYGHSDTAAVQGDQSAGGESVSSHIDDAGYREGSVTSEVGEAGHDHGEKGYVSKGHAEEGFDNVHRKVEYGYSETFGDEDEFESHDSDHDLSDSFHDIGEEGAYEEGNVQDQHSHDVHGEAGSLDKSDFEENFERIKASFAEDDYFGKHDSHDTDHGTHGSHFDKFGSRRHYIDSTHDDRLESHGGSHLNPHVIHGGLKNPDAFKLHDKSYGNQYGNREQSLDFPHSRVFASVDKGFQSGLNFAPNGGIQHYNSDVNYGPDNQYDSPLFRGDLG
ncbi:dentin sialophosphoprotein [Hyalella azteca]|uniref:Dentin sialophosphoprotein n=1 Tax=Hyalella azteca TaxID=294128 RepID=A0A8B7P5J8_HYAAZ|nr:dentin sialophosphoprotein [Hyalella azteca]